MTEKDTFLESSTEKTGVTVHHFDRQRTKHATYTKHNSINKAPSPLIIRQILCILMFVAILGQSAIGIAALTDREDGMRADEMYKMLNRGNRRTQDSPHHEILTQFDGLTGTFGIMFDVESKFVDFNVDSIDFHSNNNDNSLNLQGTPCNVLVYTREGSHIGHEDNIGSWEILIDDVITCMNFGQRSIIPPNLFLRADGSKIKVEAGKTRAFYITTIDKPVLRYSKGDIIGGTHVEDDFVVIKQGTGLGGFFDSTKLYRPRLFNGVIHYSLDGVSIDTNEIKLNIPEPELVSTILHQNDPNHNFALDGCTRKTSSDFVDNLGSYGNMFDVIAPKEDITLYGMDLYTDLPIEVEYEIYTKRGRFFENDGLKTIYAWTKLGSGSFKGKGKGIGVKVPYMSPVDIPQGVAQGFYVTLKTADLRYKNVTDISDTESGVLDLGETYIEDEFLIVEAGVGVGAYPLDPTVEFFSTRLFLGAFRYLFSSSCKTELPTPTPIRAPSTPSPTGECVSRYDVTTTLDGTSVADGIMFDVRSLQDLTITALEVKTLPLVDIAHDALLYIFTKDGMYNGFENNRSAWTKICEIKFSSTIQNQYGSTLIPQGIFKDINLKKYQIKSFYIASSETAIIYSSGTDVGTVAYNDDNLQIMQGSGLIGEKLFLTQQKFEPRIYNGVIHVLQDVDCQTTQPTPSPTLLPTPYPTLFPTIDLHAETTLVFNFDLEHSLYMTPKDIFEEINISTSKTIRGLLEHEDLFVIWRIHEDLDFVSTSSSFGEETHGAVDSCKVKAKDRICTKVDTIVTMKHLKRLDSGQLTFHLLRKSDELTANLGLGSFNTSFIGEKTLETKQLITITGVPPKNMGESETKFIEKVSKLYLDEILNSQSAVDILTVEVTDQLIHMEESRSLRESGRLLQSTSTSVEITMVITGKHQPPPEIDFPELVSDTLNEGNEGYIEKLKVPPKIQGETEEQAELSYFQHVKSIVANSVPVSSPSLSPTVKESEPIIISEKALPESKSNSTFNIIGIVSGVIGGVFVVGFTVYWMKTRKNYVRVLNKFTRKSTEEKDIGDDKHSRFLYNPRSHSSPEDLFEELKIREEDIDSKIYPIKEDVDDCLFLKSNREKTKGNKDGKKSCDNNASNRTCSTVDIENDCSNSSLNLDGFEKPRRATTRRSSTDTHDSGQSLRSSRSSKPLHERRMDSHATAREEKSSKRTTSGVDRSLNSVRSTSERSNSSFSRNSTGSFPRHGPDP